MATKKVTAEPILKNWDEVDATLLELQTIDGRVGTVEATVNAEINSWKERLAEETREDLARKARLEKDLKEYAEYHKDAMGNKRSRELNHGIVGFRRSTELAALAKLAWGQVVAKLKELGRLSFIRVKDEIDKEAIRAANLPEAELAICGMRMVDKDTFYYDLADTTAKPTG